MAEAEDTAEGKSERNVSKKTRFEVFKRDSFACVFCGRSAPEIVLHCDHLKPLAAKGSNDIMNLVTSCEDCNLGKGPRELSDQSTLAKQKANLDDLNERRVQLEMLLEWRAGLDDIEAAQVDAISDAIASHSDWKPNDSGKRDIKRWLKKFSIKELLEATDAAFVAKYQPSVHESADVQSWRTAFNAIPRFAAFKRSTIERPYLPDALYVRGILRVRHENGDLDYFSHDEALSLIEAAFVSNVTTDSLKALAKRTTVWGDFVAAVQTFCATQRNAIGSPPIPNRSPTTETEQADPEPDYEALAQQEADDREREYYEHLERVDERRRERTQETEFDFLELQTEGHFPELNEDVD